ncbi:MAG: hypothetical protein RBR97_14050 [Bacteroidales bacterium]|nr:hypothetical protein [Bacteroidales bacterium]
MENKNNNSILAEQKNTEDGKQSEILSGTIRNIQEVQPRTQPNGNRVYSEQNRVDNLNATEQEWRRGKGDNGNREIFGRGEQPIISTLLTGHKSSFDVFDRKFRGSGIGNQGGGVYFTTDANFALDAAKKSSKGGYEFNKQEATGTPYVSEVVIKNPNMVWAEKPIPSKVSEQIGEINGISPKNYKNYSDFHRDLSNTFVKDKTNFTDYAEAQNKASDALREKGITGHVIDKGEVVIYSEKDIVKIKQTKVETKEPVKEYAAKVEETAEVKSEKEIFTKEELAKEKDKQALQTLSETSKDLKSF